LFIARQLKQIRDCKFTQMFLRRLETQWIFVFKGARTASLF